MLSLHCVTGGCVVVQMTCSNPGKCWALDTVMSVYIYECAMHVYILVYLFYVASYIATHWLSHCDGIFEAKYTNSEQSAWMEKCSSKLNNFSVAFLEKNLVGGSTLSKFFLHTQALVYYNKWDACLGRKISRFWRITHSSWGPAPIRTKPHHDQQIVCGKSLSHCRTNQWVNECYVD